MFKKFTLLAIVALTVLSLSACGTSKHKSSSARHSSSKVVKHHKKKHSKKKVNKSNKQASTSSSTTNNHKQAQGRNTNEADPFDVSTWDRPYKGYSNFRAYLNAHPNTPNIQSQTAQMQHNENVRKGIENPDGSETQNFKNWEAYRDRAWENGGTPQDYDQNTNYSSGQN